MPKSPKKAKSSKASSPSWRTLMRRAEKLESNAKGTRGAIRKGLLRRAAALREQANLKHRSERKAKAPKKTKKDRMEVDAKALNRKVRRKRQAAKPDPVAQVMYGDNAAPATLGGLERLVNQEQPLVGIQRGNPGHGEIVGGAMHMLAEEIATLARKKGGKDEIQSKLMMATATARYEGERAADQRNSKQLIEVQEAYRDKVVCGFVSEMEDVMRQKGGIPPETCFTFNAWTICRIIDALNVAGYTAKGKR